jgi:hypothetical protein
MKSDRKLTLSKDFKENDVIRKKIAINYKNIPWGIANAKVKFENMVNPPRIKHNHKFIMVEAEYAGKIYRIRCIQGEVEGALMAMKKLIEMKIAKR